MAGQTTSSGIQVHRVPASHGWYWLKRGFGLLGRAPLPLLLRQKVSRTSPPTSKASGPMAGPNQAMISTGGTRMAAAVCCKMPPASPRQPAWAAATTLPARSQNNTGRQSAVITAQAARPLLSTEASASGGTGAAAASAACTTAVPCTWFR